MDRHDLAELPSVRTLLREGSRSLLILVGFDRFDKLVLAWLRASRASATMIRQISKVLADITKVLKNERVNTACVTQ